MTYVFLAEGFEELEALSVIDVFRRAGQPVQSVSITQDRAVTGAHGIPVTADLILGEEEEEAELLVLPGGMPGAANLEACQPLRDKLAAQHRAGRWIGAICAAPMVLGSCGLLKGKKATIYPGMEDRLLGATPTGEAVAKDGNIITGQGPALAISFACALLGALAGKSVAEQVAEDMLLRP